MGSLSLLSILALASAAGATIILVVYLVLRPPLTRQTKLWLFFGLGPLPIGAALTGNVANLEVTKKRDFCGSCHVMTPYVDDAGRADSSTLASIHSRSPWFGGESCYTCHADYGMLGGVTTKIGGMHHVWDFYTGDWGPGHRPPKLYRPYTGQACKQCHAPEGTTFKRHLEHQVHGPAIAAGDVTCASRGCHAPVHPSHIEEGM